MSLFAEAWSIRAEGVTLDKTVYEGFFAYRLSDGKTEAIIVPSVGRVLRYGLVGGDNFLWNAPTGNPSIIKRHGMGGDKTWLGPQSLWPLLFGRLFPPDPAWDAPQHAEVLPGPKLHLTGAVSSAGVRITREYSIDADGGLIIVQTAEKVRGYPMLLAIWSDTQIAPGDAVYLPVNPQSVYKGNFCWMSPPKRKVVLNTISDGCIEVRPEFSTTASNFYKIGVDARVASLAVARKGVAFLQHSARPSGDYADSVAGGGLAAQYFHHGHKDSLLHYDELELLSPLYPFRVGAHWTHIVRWSLHKLPSRDANFPQTRKFIESLVESPQ